MDAKMLLLTTLVLGSVVLYLVDCKATTFIPRDQQLYRIDKRFDNLTDEIQGIRQYIPVLNKFLAQSANMTKLMYQRQGVLDNLDHLADYLTDHIGRISRSTTITRKRSNKLKFLNKWIKGELISFSFYV